MKKPTNITEIWAMPVLLALLSVCGLTAALLADGWGDAVSWLTLSVPIAATLAPMARGLAYKTKNKY